MKRGGGSGDVCGFGGVEMLVAVVVAGGFVVSCAAVLTVGVDD